MDTVSTICRVGGKAPVYGSLSVAAPATVAISGSPTYELQTAAGVVIATAQSVTDWSRTALSTVQAWIDLDTLLPPGGGSALGVGRYRVLLTIVAVGSDGVTRVRRPSAILDVRA